MSIRRFRSIALAGVATSALGMGAALAQDCQQELEQVRAELGQQPIAPAARGDVRGLLNAAETLHEAGDEQGCLTVVAHIRNVAHTGAIAAPAAQTEMAAEDMEAERRARLEAAEPLHGIVRSDMLRDMNVVSRDGENLGHIADVVVDLDETRVRYALLARGGGWFGLGTSDLYPIPLAAFQIAFDGETDWIGEGDAGLEDERETRVAEVTDEEPEAAAAEQPEQQPEAEAAEQPAEEETEIAEQQEDPRADHPLYAMTAGEIEGMNVINARGENIGSVSEVYFSYAEEDVFVLVPVGGFLGFGTHDVGLPLAEMQLGDGELLLPAAVTTDHLEQLPEAEYSDEQAIPSDMVISDAVYGMADRTPEAETRRMLESENEAPEATEEPDLEQQTQEQQAQEQQAQEQQAQEQQTQEQALEQPEQQRERRDFENAVLVLRVDADALDGAPSFGGDDWPNFDDPAWHDRVVAFYEDLLGTANEEGQQAGQATAD